jgi:leader peptidase (prepilin peptidase)/N-methyltransferase
MSMQVVAIEHSFARRPLTSWPEAGFGVVAGAASVVVSLTEASGLSAMALVAVLLVVTAIAHYDLRTRRAPNRIVYPTAVMTVLVATLHGPESGALALAGGFASLFVLTILVIIGRGAMGFGDAKVGFICGAVVGPSGLLPMFLATFATGGVLAAILLAARVRGRKDSVAFTPFLLAGVLVALVFWVQSPVAGG